MEVILIEKVPSLGSIGDSVKVSPGYARNWLLPKKKALEKNAANAKKFEDMRHELEKKELAKTQDLELKFKKIKELALSFSMKASDDGRLYGSISARDIEKLLASMGIEVEHSHIKVPGYRIRNVGEHTITFTYGDASLNHNVIIIAS